MVHSVRDLQVLEVLGGFRLHFEAFRGVWLSLGRISSVACSLEVFHWLVQAVWVQLSGFFGLIFGPQIEK
jgi:hypothetical protein